MVLPRPTSSAINNRAQPARDASTGSSWWGRMTAWASIAASGTRRSGARAISPARRASACCGRTRLDRGAPAEVAGRSKGTKNVAHRPAGAPDAGRRSMETTSRRTTAGPPCARSTTQRRCRIQTTSPADDMPGRSSRDLKLQRKDTLHVLPSSPRAGLQKLQRSARNSGRSACAGYGCGKGDARRRPVARPEANGVRQASCIRRRPSS